MTDQSTLAKDLRTARERGESPTAPGADLRGADLCGADLRDTDLREADLYVTALYGANLRGGNLRYANLLEADLHGANLYGANLYCADLHGANLHGADLYGANLSNAAWEGLSINGLPSGHLLLIPTSEGWHLVVGCWEGSMNALAELIDQDEGWPEAEGEEIQRRRPFLQAALTRCRAHVEDRQRVIEDLKERWGDD